MARSSTPGKTSCHATWKQDLHAPTTYNGTFTRPPPTRSPVLYNVYTNGLVDLNSNGLCRVLWLRTTGLSTKQPVTSTQQSPPSRSSWKRCHVGAKRQSEIKPNKAQDLWCTLNNKAVGQAMPAVSFNGEAKERTNSLRYFRIHFDRILTYKTQVESTKLRCKKGLSALNAMASQGIEQRQFFLLYQI